MMKLLHSRNFFAELLRHCKSLRGARAAHADLVKAGLDRNDTFLGNLVVQMYARCGSLEYSRAAFERIEKPNVFSWMSIITAYTQNGHLDNALSLFDQVSEPDVILCTAMLTAFVENGRIKEARNLFQGMPGKNVVSWNSMISGFVHAGMREEAFGTFKEMDLEGFCPNSVSILSGCLSLAEGKIVHDSIAFADFETKLGNALIGMYSRLNKLEDARDVFEHDLGLRSHTVQTFAKMDLEGVTPNRVTFVSILNCCSTASAVSFIHAEAVAAGFQAHTNIDNALIRAYARAGSSRAFHAIFSAMPERDTVSFIAAIIAYAQQGSVEESLRIPCYMDIHSISRNKITFTNIFSVYSRSGMVKRSWEELLSMQADFQMEPSPDHYLCFMELLGKAGKLEEAEDLIRSMPYEPDFEAWNTLLGSFEIHSDSSRGTRATQGYVDLSPGKATPYVLVFNINDEFQISVYILIN